MTLIAHPAMRTWYVFVTGTLFFILLLFGETPRAVFAQARNLAADAQPVLVAYPIPDALAIDGRLDEAGWQQAEAVSAFRQFEPNEGAPASRQAEVRVLYGPGNLYVGALLYDDPAEIERALGRRDEVNRADWFLVSIDSYFDRRTAYTFGVNAAGVQFDAIRTGEGGGGPGGGGGGGGGIPGADESWDAIWYSDVRVTSEGWVVEMRIPYSMLRFPEAATQTWGIHFTRQIPRLGEQSEWPLVPRTERSNLVAQFGRLTGITDVAPRRNLQISPYTVTQLRMEERLDAPGEATRDGSIDAGVDLKVGLGPNITLDATINPDFGQVESDPAVLNLTAFETFFDERRPFFVEGSQIYTFSVGPGQLLYTRRVGGAAPIVGAGKLSGRTGSGLSFGVLGAATGADFNPSRQYGVARMSQQIGAYSSAGGIVTAFNAPGVGRDGRRNSVAGGADWDLRFAGNRYGIEGFASVTHRRRPEPGVDATTGVAGKVWARRRQGVWQGFVGLDVFGDTFDPNDVGQLRENNFIAVLNSLEHEINGSQPFGPFLRASAEAFTIQRFSYEDGRNLGLSVDVGSRWMLRGFQQIEVDLSSERLFGGYDLFETRGLDPWAAPSMIEVGGEFQTDERRPWQVEPELSLTFQRGGGREYALGLRGNWNVGTQLSLSANLEGEWEDGVLAWSSNEVFQRRDEGWMIGADAASPEELGPDDYVLVDDQGLLDGVLAGIEPFDAPGSYYVPVFGERDTRSIDFTLRSTVTFTPNLSLQFYGQLFTARGRYDRFQIMQNPDDLASFDRFPKRDEFALSSFQSNVVMRWEYRPGSVLFLVWTQGRRADDVLHPLAPSQASPYDRSVDRQIADTFDIFPDNVFLIKLSYTFLR